MADAEVGDIHVDDFGKVFGEAADGEFTDDDFEDTAIVFDAIGLADGFDGDEGLDGFVGGDGVEVHVKDIAADGVMLHLLNEGEAFALAGFFFDEELDEEVFAGGVGEEVFKFAFVDLDVEGGGGFAIDDGRDGAAGADAFDGVGAGFGAGFCGKLGLFGHR